ncbi:MAG: hypothetical protein P8O76_00840 [Methylophilaceae bacterium]|nr:hypothetical protein [Methylophilaceae bacterium]
MTNKGKISRQTAVAMAAFFLAGGNAWANYAAGTGVSASALAYATAVGENAQAAGDYSTALGNYAEATNNYSTAIGYFAKAEAAAAKAEAAAAKAMQAELLRRIKAIESKQLLKK